MIIDKFINNLVKLTSGTVLAQIIIIVASPVLTRIYKPEVFGEYSTLLALINIITVFSMLRYEFALPLSRTKRQTIDLLKLSIVLLVISSISIALILSGFGEYGLKKLGLASIKDVVYLIPISLFALGIYRATTIYLATRELYGLVSFAKLTQSIVIVTIQVIFSKFSIVGLLLGNIFGNAISMYYLREIIDGRTKLRKLHVLRLVALLKKYYRFPIYDIWYALFFSLGQRLPVIIFASQYGLATAGYYALAHKVLATPMTIVGSSVAKIFYVDSKSSIDRNEINLLFERTQLFLLSLVIIPLAAVWNFGEEISLFVFGKEWIEAGKYMEIMSVWLFFQFIISPLSSIFNTFNRQKIGALFQFILLFGRILSLLLGHKLYESIAISLSIYVYYSSFIYFLMFLYLARLCNINYVRLIVRYTFILLYVVFVMFVSNLIKEFTSSLLLALCFVVLSFVVLNINNYSALKKHG